MRNAKNADLIFDPFCGRGTTNYAARLRGLRSYGVDSNPVAFAIAQSKLIDTTAKEIIALCLDIILHHDPIQYPSGKFWDWAYHSDTLVDICRLRDYFLLKKRLNKTEIALRALILGILHGPKMKSFPSYLSNQMSRTFAMKPEYSLRYWQERGLKPEYVNVFELVKRKAHYIFNDQLPQKVKGHIVLGDSRELSHIPDEKFDWIITSPPYYGMSSYEQDQWLRNWFMGGSDAVDYSRKTQLKYWSQTAFVNDLSKVWKNAALKSNSNAKLIIRFGALPSKSDKSPAYLIKQSISLASAGWKIHTIRKAGKPSDAIRQANQFKNSPGKYIEEIDVFAELKN